jgi:hypothetical protein
VYSPPAELLPKPRAAPQAAEPIEASMANLTVELRCNDCIKTFGDEKALIAHCSQMGHSPVMVGDKGAKVANISLFLQYANVVLKRALGERLAPW